MNRCAQSGFIAAFLDGFSLGPLWRALGLMKRNRCERGSDGYCAKCHERMYP